MKMITEKNKSFKNASKKKRASVTVMVAIGKPKMSAPMRSGRSTSSMAAKYKYGK